ncbi:MAG: UbiA prenyltransferase [halophilic archaeon J07HX64]|jgi:4-hydroxybenzoate polyprenyltransferase and related prenyltransferases|nr:MAG: UbiA prenyltransferase [halophilic archaeon J07HX64]
MGRVSERLAQFAPSEQSAVGYLFWLSRPRFWLYLAGPVVVGVVYAASAPAGFFQPVAVALFLYFLVPANVFLYGVNDIFDADIDELNPKKAAEGREVRYGDNRGWHVVAPVVTAAALAAVFVPVVPDETLIAVAGFLVLGAAYSVPPFRLKTTPLLDSVSNGLYILPGVAAYAAVSGSYPPLVGVAGGWVWAMGMHTFSAIPDIEPDREAGIRTTATLLGALPTLAYCGVCWLFAAALMGLVHPALAAVFLVYPLFIVVVAVADIDIDRAYWWFPVLNTVAGAVLTMMGIWEVQYA